MSGGSFDYALHDTWDFSKAESLLGKLYDMRGCILTEYPDAVPYLTEMAVFIEHTRDEYLKRGAKIYDLLEQIEWTYSGDRGEEDILEAIRKLKEKKDG